MFPLRLHPRLLRRTLLALGLSAVAAVATPVRAQSTAGGVGAGSTEIALDAFVLGPGDVLKVTIWREKELSGSFQVDEYGMMTLPMLGRVRGAGILWRDLRDSLLTRYTAQLKTTSIILLPQRRVFVFGEVTKPGAVLLDPTLSFAGAVALAGGAGPEGDLRRIRIVRNGKTLRENAPIESLFVGTDLRSDDQLYVGKRSWFDRNSTFIAGAALSLTSIIVSLIRR